MTNHVHAIVIPERDDSLAVLFRRVHGRYAQYVNTRRGRSGGNCYDSVDVTDSFTAFWLYAGSVRSDNDNLPLRFKAAPQLGYTSPMSGYQKVFAAAFKSAFNDLNKPKCASDFGGASDDLQMALTNATYELTDTPIPDANGKPDPTVAASTNQATGKVTINDLGTFFAGFDGTVPVKMGGQVRELTSDQTRVYTLLHELGHLVGMNGEIDANKDDNAFNKSILQDCLNVKFE